MRDPFLEGFLDFVGILAHRACAEWRIIVLLPKGRLPLDVARLGQRLRLTVIAEAADRRAIHQIGREVLAHAQRWHSQLHEPGA